MHEIRAESHAAVDDKHLSYPCAGSNYSTALKPTGK